MDNIDTIKKISLVSKLHTKLSDNIFIIRPPISCFHDFPHKKKKG